MSGEHNYSTEELSSMHPAFAQPSDYSSSGGVYQSAALGGGSSLPIGQQQPAMGLGNAININQKQAEMQQKLVEFQMNEVMRMYNLSVQKCFDYCVDSFLSNELTRTEKACTLHCVQKFLKATNRMQDKMGDAVRETNTELFENSTAAQSRD